MITKLRSSYPGKSGLESRGSAIAVPQTDLTEVAVIPTLGVERLMVQVEVVGQALAEFTIGFKAVQGGQTTTLYSATADFTTLPAGGLLVGTSGDLTLQAAGSTGWFLMDVRGLAEVVISASSSNVAGSTLNISAGGA